MLKILLIKLNFRNIKYLIKFKKNYLILIEYLIFKRIINI